MVRPGGGLTWRIFSSTAATVALVALVLLAAIWALSARAADDATRAALATTRAHIDGALTTSRAALVARTRIYMLNAEVRSALEQVTDSGDYVDQAVTIAQETGASWVQLVDARGIRVAKSDEPTAPPADVSRSALVRAALADSIGRGFGRTGAPAVALFDGVAVPYYGAGNQRIGVVVAGLVLTDSVAQRLADESGSAIAVVAGEGDSAVVVAASREIDRAAVARALAAHSRTASTDEGGADAREGMVVRLDGHDYVATFHRLRTAGPDVVGAVVALHDRDAVLAPFRRLQWLVLGAALLGLGIAFATSLGTARRITRPLHALVDATRRAADGDYDAPLPAARGDEVGELAGAFSRLLADLREKQALVDVLQGPVTMARGADSPTLLLHATGAAALAPGAVFAGRYEIRRVLGAGGMGTVYEAHDRELDEPVAIKTLRKELLDDDGAALERFRSEIRLARRISHRNVVRTHDIGEWGGVYYITMERVEGHSLKEVIVQRGRLPAAAVVPIARQLARALAVAHEAGVIHRDVKPHNMVVEGNGVLKVMDFGIARLAQRTNGPTQAGMIIGTPEYMAPEQLVGDVIDARADVYAAGAVMYECLTGRLPHEADTLISLIARVLEETPVPPAQRVDGVPPALSDLVMHALARRVEDRVPSAAALLERLERIA